MGHDDRMGPEGSASGKGGLQVAPSPLNGIKLDLGVALALTPVAWLAVERLVVEPGAQLLWLGGYGLAAMVWLVVRVRRELQRWEEGGGGPKAQ